MQREFTRDEIEAATKLIASLYCANRDILSKDDKFCLCQANRIIEELAKKYPHESAVVPDSIDIDMDASMSYGSIINDVAQWHDEWNLNHPMRKQ